MSITNLTAWLEYSVTGLATQLTEVQHKGESLIKQDVVAIRHGLSSRRKAALGLALTKQRFRIQDLEQTFPGINRRTLQRELKDLIGKGLLVTDGAARNFAYPLSEQSLGD
jgi:hypothetical protein